LTSSSLKGLMMHSIFFMQYCSFPEFAK